MWEVAIHNTWQLPLPYPVNGTTLESVTTSGRTNSKGRTMEITAELRTLAKFPAGPLPVISVYLNTQWRDPHQRARTTTFFAHHLHQARALEPETEAARSPLPSRTCPHTPMISTSAT